jgi:hypothetical protein
MPTGVVKRPPSAIIVTVGVSMVAVIVAQQGLETIQLKKDRSFSMKSVGNCSSL